jgi:hypothetical protein
MLTIGKTAEKSGRVIETEALVQILGIQNRTAIAQRLELDGGPEGKGGVVIQGRHGVLSSWGVALRGAGPATTAGL